MKGEWENNEQERLAISSTKSRLCLCMDHNKLVKLYNKFKILKDHAESDSAQSCLTLATHHTTA